MKSFIKKHPYLFFALLGIGFILISLAYIAVAALMDMDMETINYLFIVLNGMAGILLITLSPLIILIIRNGKKYTTHWDNLIMQLYTIEKGNKSELIIGFTMVGIVILGAIGMLVVGENISLLLGMGMFILSFYVDALLFKMYKARIISRFYKVTNVTDKFKVLQVKDTVFLDDLYKGSSLVFAVKPDEHFLKFIYNWLNNKGLLRDECVNLFIITGKDIREKYNFRLIEDSDTLQCIMLGYLNFNEESLKAFSQQYYLVGGRRFDALVDSCMEFIECTGCKLGRLGFCTDIDTGKVFLACNDGKTYFDTPEDAFNEIPSQREYHNIRKATSDEIKKAGWENFIKQNHWTIKD